MTEYGGVVTGEDRAREPGHDGGLLRPLPVGFARGEEPKMPKVPMPAARATPAEAGLGTDDLDAVKTHNPFAANDAYFSRQTGAPVEELNDGGSSRIFGHPQGPKGAGPGARLS